MMKERLVEEFLKLMKNEDVIILDMHGEYDHDEFSHRGMVESIPTGYSTITFNLLNKEVSKRFQERISRMN